MGTPDLAAVGLQSLLNDKNFDIISVITQADKKAGRDLKVLKSPVKLLAEKYNLIIKQPDKLKDIIPFINETKPDLIVVIAYGKILPKTILDIPKYNCINVHASLLPKYRGSACIPAPILNGDKISGISIMKMDENMDTGPIIEQIKIDLDSDETSLTLSDKIKEVIKENLTAVLKNYINSPKITEQENNLATYVKMIEKEDGHIDLKNDSAEMIERKIRAYTPWPGTFAFITKDNLSKNKLLFKIIKSEKEIIEDKQHQAGELFLNNNKLVLKCSDAGLILKEIQLAGKKAMTVNETLKGNSWIIGKILE